MRTHHRQRVRGWLRVRRYLLFVCRMGVEEGLNFGAAVAVVAGIKGGLSSGQPLLALDGLDIKAGNDVVEGRKQSVLSASTGFVRVLGAF